MAHKHGVRSIQQLVQEANNYEYSDTVPLKVYLRTADTLSRHAELYQSGESYEDAYVLYIRFLDLLMNRIALNPQLKRDPNLLKAYDRLVINKAPTAFQNAEVVKNILLKRLASHERYLSIVEDNERKKKELLSIRQKRLSMEKDHLSSSPSYSSSLRSVTPEIDDFDDGQLNGQLSTLLSQQRPEQQQQQQQATVTDAHLPSAAYPQLPQHHHQLSIDDSSPQAPPSLPLKELSSLSSPQFTITPPTLPPKLEDVNSSQSSISISDKLHHLTQSLHLPHKPAPKHRSIASTEGGTPLKTIYTPSELQSQFLSIAESNTSKKLETCGILCGKLSLNAFFITTLVIPSQESTENTCQTNDEESLFEFVDTNDLFVLGWIHTHPTQSCFLSSVDLHTQNSYQIMLPEAIAIVCSPRAVPNFGVFRLSDPRGISIVTQCHRSGFHPHTEADLYKNAESLLGGHVVIKQGLPFTYVDLRK